MFILESLNTQENERSALWEDLETFSADLGTNHF